jgi:nitroimidazol reductase NimA-like FMN-containing flavoprotein (pyridoxamine 5'-phosphate oxidase superfamily)
MNTADKKAMTSFMAERFFCVVSTVGADSRPESAFVGYTSSDSHEIIIGTSRQSRKFQNVSKNSSVAIVIADMSGEVQYEGDVEIITPEAYDKLIAAGRFNKLGGYDKYRNDPTQMYLHIKPTWIRFIVHGENDQITEFTEFA